MSYAFYVQKTGRECGFAPIQELDATVWFFYFADIFCSRWEEALWTTSI